jgi:hypothetical protein
VKTNFLEAKLKVATRASRNRRDGVTFIESTFDVRSGSVTFGKTTSLGTVQLQDDSFHMISESSRKEHSLNSVYATRQRQYFYLKLSKKRMVVMSSTYFILLAFQVPLTQNSGLSSNYEIMFITTQHEKKLYQNS